VNLAQIAVETACLDSIRIFQRSLGFATFVRGTLIELLFRDLGMYLCHPAPAESFDRGRGPFHATRASGGA
jgi:hypothetical protein